MLQLRTPFDDFHRHPKEAESLESISRALDSAAVAYPNHLDRQGSISIIGSGAGSPPPCGAMITSWRASAASRKPRLDRCVVHQFLLL